MRIIPRTPKWRLVWVLTVLSVIGFSIGQLADIPVLFIPAILFAYMTIGVLAFGSSREKSYAALVVDGLFWNLIP